MMQQIFSVARRLCLNGPRATTRRIGIAWRNALHQLSLYVNFDHFPECELTSIDKIFKVDYRLWHGELWEALPAEELVAIASAPNFLGNKRIKTQHFVGAATKWVRKSDTEVTGHHQMRVAHQKYKDDELKEVLAQGHYHGGATMHYRKIDGEWKFAGVEPVFGWAEFDPDQIFRDC